MTTLSPDPLVVTGLEKRYGTVQALAGASFSLKRGELLGLLGPNGAGKTTMIKCIAGRSAPDRGQITVLGRVLAPTDARPAIGVVPQELAIYKRLTARENLTMFGRLAGVPAADIRARVDWALGWADLGERADEPTEGFSGGMKRRLNIACSLLHRPAIVLLDEPTVGVDPQSRARIYEMLAALQRDGVSIVLTTHHLEEAEQRCQRIVIIDRGTIVASGTVAELVGQSIGAVRRLTLSLTDAWPDRAPVPDGFEIDGTRHVVAASVRDVGPDSTAVLAAIGAAGARVADVRIVGATLQDVFIALTGRELRE